MRTLVIGGTEFIGRHTVEELLRRGHDVTLFHRGRSPNPFGDQVRELFGDRMRARDVRNAFSSEAFDAVIDLVYVWGPGTGPSQVAPVLDAAGNALERYVFLSSCGVYDPHGPLPATEDSPRAPALGLIQRRQDRDGRFPARSPTGGTGQRLHYTTPPRLRPLQQRTPGVVVLGPNRGGTPRYHPG